MIITLFSDGSEHAVIKAFALVGRITLFLSLILFVFYVIGWFFFFDHPKRTDDLFIQKNITIPVKKVIDLDFMFDEYIYDYINYPEVRKQYMDLKYGDLKLVKNPKASFLMDRTKKIITISYPDTDEKKICFSIKTADECNELLEYLGTKYSSVLDECFMRVVDEETERIKNATKR